MINGRKTFKSIALIALPILLLYIVFNLIFVGDTKKINQNELVERGVSAPSDETPTSCLVQSKDWYSTLTTSNYDFSCLVDATKKIAQHSLLIDIRPSKTFQNMHIQNSLSMTLTELTHQKRIKEKEVVIVGRGTSRKYMASVCDFLVDKGFNDIKIVVGGVSALSVHGAKLSPIGPIDKELYTIKPSEAVEYFLDANYEKGVLLQTELEGNNPVDQSSWETKLNVVNAFKMDEVLSLIATLNEYNYGEHWAPIIIVGDEHLYKKVINRVGSLISVMSMRIRRMSIPREVFLIPIMI